MLRIQKNLQKTPDEYKRKYFPYDVPRWHKILTFLAAELPPMPPSETP